MSRIGRLPVSLPAGVTVAVEGGEVQVSGPLGKLSQAVVGSVEVQVEGDTLLVQRVNDSKVARSNHGLMRSLVSNMVTGVTKGFSKQLEIVGVGYRADVKGTSLVMNLGYSHPIDFPIPDGIQIAVDRNVRIDVKGINKQQVGQVAAMIRDFRRPDHYKGKGVRYVGEYVRIKTGKSA
ncbi:MAG: 50S ribosomal protein L6 [Deltaproteobacteria bacterium]|nr:50S ribosomal protein L6 [Deltaproteobacteria bacterium]